MGRAEPTSDGESAYAPFRGRRRLAAAYRYTGATQRPKPTSTPAENRAYGGVRVARFMHRTEFMEYLLLTDMHSSYLETHLKRVGTNCTKIHSM